MKITHQLLELYNVGVNAGLDLKLNLWTRDGDEFFLFLAFLDPSIREPGLGAEDGEVMEKRNTSKDVRSPLQSAGPSQVRERSHLQVARPCQVD